VITQPAYEWPTRMTGACRLGDDGFEIRRLSAGRRRREAHSKQRVRSSRPMAVETPERRQASRPPRLPAIHAACCCASLRGVAADVAYLEAVIASSTARHPVGHSYAGCVITACRAPRQCSPRSMYVAGSCPTWASQSPTSRRLPVASQWGLPPARPLATGTPSCQSTPTASRTSFAPTCPTAVAAFMAHAQRPRSWQAFEGSSRC